MQKRLSKQLTHRPFAGIAKLMPVPAKAPPFARAVVTRLRPRANDVPPAPPVTTSWAELSEAVYGDDRLVPDNVVQLRSTRKDIRAVYESEVRQGTSRRVLRP